MFRIGGSLDGTSESRPGLPRNIHIECLCVLWYNVSCVHLNLLVLFSRSYGGGIIALLL